MKTFRSRDRYNQNHCRDDGFPELLSGSAVHKKKARNNPHQPRPVTAYYREVVPHQRVQNHLSPYQSVKVSRFGWRRQGYKYVKVNYFNLQGKDRKFRIIMRNLHENISNHEKTSSNNHNPAEHSFLHVRQRQPYAERCRVIHHGAPGQRPRRA